MSDTIDIPIALEAILKHVPLTEVVSILVNLHTPYFSEYAKGIRVGQVRKKILEDWPLSS